jgi:hypothetical protein
MAIEIGAQIQGIMQRSVQYQDQGAPATLYIRDVTFQIVGMPDGVPAPLFSIAVTDATQWDTLQVGQTCTITITPPP